MARKASEIAVDPGRGEGDRSYAVRVGAGLLAEAGRLIEAACPAHRYALITDDIVGPLYADRVAGSLGAAGLRSTQFRFPAGEASKTRESWARLSDELVAAEVGRDAAVIALGGGVVGDLAGFVAASYMRGLPIVQVPTTLLAMLDSSVGGKTGVDTEAAKNLIGAFHQPRLVLIDPETLGSLPARLLAAGLAEAYKHGLILDADYFAWLDEKVERVFALDAGVLEELIVRSVGIKARVVGADERESGYRRILNFGHTVAHALEASRGYSGTHGEAVAVGMVAEAAIGEVLGITESGVAPAVRSAIARARLPIAPGPEVDADRFFSALRSDKKRAGGEDRMVLLRTVGRVAGGEEGGWTHRVGEDVVREVVFGGGRRV